jgi:hypothetical protein
LILELWAAIVGGRRFKRAAIGAFSIAGISLLLIGLARNFDLVLVASTMLGLAIVACW